MEGLFIKICLYTIYHPRNGRPSVVGICKDGIAHAVPIYLPGVKIKLNQAERRVAAIRDMVFEFLANGHTVVVSNFKAFLDGFRAPLCKERLNVYDLSLRDIKVPSDLVAASEAVKRIALAMHGVELAEWQRVMANASMVYASLERRGILIGGVRHYPKWSQQTFSGRSKTLAYNLQGAPDTEPIVNPAGLPGDIMLHFDWVAADIRVAGLLSQDEELQRACMEADPYQYVADRLSAGRDNPLERKVCKLALLSCINAMDTSAEILGAFPTLKRWIINSQKCLCDGKPLYTILRRPFSRCEGRKDLGVFNATMQGSIVHAMQAVIHSVWGKVGNNLLTEIHDSLVVTCPISALKSTMNTVSEIMLRPFVGILDNDPVFPVRVSVGKSWRKWKEFKVFSRPL